MPRPGALELHDRRRPPADIGLRNPTNFDAAKARDSVPTATDMQVKRLWLQAWRAHVRSPEIMDISIAMTFRTGNGSCGGWSYSVWVLCNT